jgi:hypothetical protein
MTDTKPTELQHAKWRVNFLKRLLNTHRVVRYMDIEAWMSQEADFLHRLQRAEAALDTLEKQCAG